MDEKKRKWPNLIPEPTGDPPLEPVIFGDNGRDDSPVSNTDPDGSYTGIPVDGGRPVQDADDL